MRKCATCGTAVFGADQAFGGQMPALQVRRDGQEAQDQVRRVQIPEKATDGKCRDCCDRDRDDVPESETEADTSATATDGSQSKQAANGHTQVSTAATAQVDEDL